MDRIVTTIDYSAIYTGKGEFYSGIVSGETVRMRVTLTQYNTPDGPCMAESIAVQSFENPGAWLAIYDRDNVSRIRLLRTLPKDGACRAHRGDAYRPCSKCAHLQHQHAAPYDAPCNCGHWVASHFAGDHS